MDLVKEPKTIHLHLEDENLPLPSEMLKSLCFNCENRHSCFYKETRKIYCELFE